MLLQGYYIMIPNTECNHPSRSQTNYSLLWVNDYSFLKFHSLKSIRLSKQGEEVAERGHNQGRCRASEQGWRWASMNTRELIVFWCNTHWSIGGNSKRIWHWAVLWEGDGHLDREYWEGILLPNKCLKIFSSKMLALIPGYLRQYSNWSLRLIFHHFA